MNDTRSINDEEMIEAKVRYVTFRNNDSDFAICSMDRLDRKEVDYRSWSIETISPR